jgi:branched-chain amino acid transport system ATP-binding protein
MTSLRTEGLSKAFGGVLAVDGATVELREGKINGLIGPNGSGKTTFFNLITGMIRPDSGRVRYRGHDITGKAPHEIARAGIAWVPDDRRIFPTLTVERNLTIAMKRTPFRAWSFGEVLGCFTALEYLRHRDCENLSGGEMQMVAIARALLGSPGLVLFDEPSQGLAPKVVRDVVTLIGRLKAEGVGALVVEQNAPTALAVSDRVYVMDRGTIVHEGPAHELRDDAERRRRLLGV